MLASTRLLTRVAAAAPLLLLLLASPAAAASRYHSAKCLSRGQDCNNYLEVHSVHCKAHLAPSAQNSECYRFACMWCNLPGRSTAAPCLAPFVRTLCKLDVQPAPAPTEEPTITPEPTNTPEPSMSPEEEEEEHEKDDDAAVVAAADDVPENPAALSGARALPERRPPASCTWTGNDTAVIDLGAVAPATGWTPVQRDGYSGLVYRKELNHGVDQPGKGVMCFPVKLSQAGDYFLTAVSYAPHVTEWNDDWMTTSKPMRLWRINDDTFFTRPPMKYLKAYQNNGWQGGMSNEMKTKDHDGHRFTVLGVQAGETIRVCMAGRSYRYEVYRLVLRLCSGTLCSGGNLWNADSFAVSPCM